MREPITEEAILGATRRNLFKGSQHSWFTEVKSALWPIAGSRRADAIVVSHSQEQVAFASFIEAKINRASWLSELSKPEKSEPFRRYCKFWWLVALPGIVGRDEIQDGWGLIEVDGSAECSVVVDALPHETEPLTWDLVSSILKNQHDRDCAQYMSGRMHGIREASSAVSDVRVALFREKEKIDLLEVDNLMLKEVHNKLLAELRSSVSSILGPSDHDREKAGA